MFIKRLFTSIISFVLGAAVAGGTVYGIMTTKQTNDVVETSSSTFIAKPEEEHGISLTTAKLTAAEVQAYSNDIESNAVDAYRITATVGPDYANVKTVEWVIDWDYYHDSTIAAWSAGKDANDYVGVRTVDNTDGLEAVVYTKKGFSKWIALTCRSVANPDVNASVQLHYVRRLLSFDDNGLNSINTMVLGQTYDVEALATFSEYTDSGDYSVRITLGIDEDFGTCLKSWMSTVGIAGYFTTKTYAYNIDWTNSACIDYTDLVDFDDSSWSASEKADRLEKLQSCVYNTLTYGHYNSSLRSDYSGYDVFEITDLYAIIEFNGKTVNYVEMEDKPLKLICNPVSVSSVEVSPSVYYL
jgi:hypothetical protein